MLRMELFYQPIYGSVFLPPMMWTIWMEKTRGIFLRVDSMVLLLVLPIIFHGIILEKYQSHWLINSQAAIVICSGPPVQLEESTTLFAPLSDNRPVWPLHHLVHCAEVKDEYCLKYVSSLLQQEVSLENEVITRASYNSQLIGVKSVKPRAEIGMFPMMKHGMELAKKETMFLNPGQNVLGHSILRINSTKWMGRFCHCDNVIMGKMAYQITSLTSVYSSVYSGANQIKHQSSASLAFVKGIYWWPVNSPRKGQ